MWSAGNGWYRCQFGTFYMCLIWPWGGLLMSLMIDIYLYTHRLLPGVDWCVWIKNPLGSLECLELYKVC